MSLPCLHIHDDVPAWLNAVNHHVGILGLLEHYGLGETLKDLPDGELVGPCPLCHGRQPNEFYVYNNWNTWACYGCCHRGGTPLDFVSLKEGVDYVTAALLLEAWFSLDLVKLKLVTPENAE